MEWIVIILAALVLYIVWRALRPKSDEIDLDELYENVKYLQETRDNLRNQIWGDDD